MKEDLQNKQQGTSSGGVPKTLLALALTLIVVIAAALAPAVLFKIQDQTLLQTAQPRVRLGGTLSDASYFSWALHTRYRSSNIYGPQEELTLDEALEKMSNILDELVSDSILPESVFAMLYENIQPTADADTHQFGYNKDNFGFEALDFYCYGNYSGYFNMGVLRDTRTGKVSELYISNSYPDKTWIYDELLSTADYVMDNYLAFLNIGRPEDWVPEEVDVERFGVYNADILASCVNREEQLEAIFFMADYYYIRLAVIPMGYN